MRERSLAAGPFGVVAGGGQQLYNGLHVDAELGDQAWPPRLIRYAWFRGVRRSVRHHAAMELIAALLGAVVGGAITAVVSWLHTRRAMRHEFELFSEGLAADREAARASLQRAAAVQALQAIAALDAAMPHMDHRFAFLGGDVPGYVHRRRARAEQAIDELRRAQVAALPLLGDELQRQWERLAFAADTASRVDEIGGDESVAASEELGRLASLAHQALVDLAGDAGWRSEL